MRSLLAAALLTGLVQGDPAGASCAARADALEALFAAANHAGISASALAEHATSSADTELAAAAGALRGALESALAERSATYASLGCPAAELAVDELWIRAGERRIVPGGARIVATNGASVRGSLAARGPGGLALVTVLGELVLEGTVVAAADVRLESRTGNVRVGRSFVATAAGDVVVSAAAGSIFVAPRDASDPPPFPPGTALLSFHDAAPTASPYATELSER